MQRYTPKNRSQQEKENAKIKKHKRGQGSTPSGGAIVNPTDCFLKRATLTAAMLMEISEPMPMKQIDVNGKPYLQRYYAGTLPDGKDVWLHRFLSADGDRHLHNHPFEAKSVVLSGGYAEELEGRMRPRTGYVLVVSLQDLMLIAAVCPGLTITPFRWHRIASVEPDTWTLMVVKPDRLPYWYFRDEEGNLESVPASPREWWHGYRPRGHNAGDVL